MQKVTFMGLYLAVGAAAGCSGFDRAVEAVGKTDAVVLSGDGGSRALVSPRYQARIMTTQVGAVDSVGFVCFPELAEGETHAHFNNFGGQDRFWLGPEAGQFGIYFPPGAELTRDIWRVPADFNQGPFTVVEKTPSLVRFRREMSVDNYLGARFQVLAEREVGLIPPEKLPGEVGAPLPAGLSYAGSYSDNKVTNAGPRPWTRDTGLLNIWVLGQFVPGPRVVILAPVKPGEGPAYRDAPYFGKVPEDRLKVVGGVVLFRADARKEGKIGIPQRRTTGRAGSFDFDKNLLIVVQFDVPSEPALYGNSAWVKQQPDPYAGDLFQTYNNDARPGTPGARYPFYELESVSPSRELKPGESVRHRHATYCFQGDYGKLSALARQVLGADLDQVKKAMF